MARPRDEGLKYFPHDTDASSDLKIEPLLLLHGAKGYAFYFIHLEYIYRDKDLELDISDAETRQIICQKLKITDEEYSQILSTALKKSCFDKDYFEQTGKLTSNGVKKRAGNVLRKRETERIRSKKISAAETMPETPESKVNKTKENEIKEDHVVDAAQEARKNVIGFYEKNVCATYSPVTAEKLFDWTDEIGQDIVILAMNQAVDNDARKFSYINEILVNWTKKGVKTINQATQLIEEWKDQKNGQARGPDETKTKQERDEFLRMSGG